MQVVTTGRLWADIDGFAAVLAFAEMQRLLGKEAVPIFEGTLNQSVTKRVQELGFAYDKELGSTNVDTFAMMDVSEPAFFPSFVNIEKVDTVYDHHFGFEDYWKQKIGTGAKIEEIGAAATLVFEDIVANGLLQKMENRYVLAIYTAILSNSLNLKASVTKERDVKAVEQMRQMGVTHEDWDEEYFNDVAGEIYANPVPALRNDTKVWNVNGSEIKIAQLEFWNSSDFIQKNKEIILSALESPVEDISFLDCPSISEGKTYFVAKNQKTKELLSRIFNLHFDNETAILDKLILRKEIIRAMS